MQVALMCSLSPWELSRPPDEPLILIVQDLKCQSKKETSLFSHCTIMSETSIFNLLKIRVIVHFSREYFCAYYTASSPLHLPIWLGIEQNLKTSILSPPALCSLSRTAHCVGTLVVIPTHVRV